jgi:uncharacterized membrane protein
MTVFAGARAYGVQGASRVGLVIGAFCVPAIIYLDYIQLAVIHATCSDCELAHFLGLILFALFIVIYRADRKSKQQN